MANFACFRQNVSPQFTVPTNNIWKAVSAAPGIIREAAKSLAGFASLVTILLFGVASIFFWNSPDMVKLPVFLILIGAAGWLFSAVRSAASVDLVRPGPLTFAVQPRLRDGKGRFITHADGGQPHAQTQNLDTR